MMVDYSFVIFGKIIHTDFFIKLLDRNGFPKPLVIVSLDEEYFRDERLLSPFGLYSDVEALARDGLCNLYKMKTVNCQEVIDLLDQYKVNVGISINCRNIIKKEIIDYFDNPILNLHDSYLPDERGGALNTWRILNGVSEVGNTLHVLEEGVDTGAILVQEKTLINKDKPYPIDYLQAESINCEIILQTYVNSLVEDKALLPVNQENDKSYYYPRLYTEVNGIINWDWDINSIEQFVRAFASPYPGAWSLYQGDKIHILSCQVENSVNRFHPFANGKIVTILDDKSVRVIAGGRPLIIQSIGINGQQRAPGEVLRIKHSLQSPDEQLKHARYHVPTTLSMNKSETKYKEK
ncbi:formyltransferase family protein [Paracoccaceae bacterium]|nr:formyltransferase family protein [Paracoccaceae bacterium]